MRNKLAYLIKISLNKKVKTKWFLIANIIFSILIIGLVNIDNIITMFGGDFNDEVEILVIDNIGEYNTFESSFIESSSIVDNYVNAKVTKAEEPYETILETIKEDNNKILLELKNDEENLISAKITSNNSVGNITKTLINASVNNIYSKLSLKKYNISLEEYQSITKAVYLESEVLSEDAEDDDILTTIITVITIPVFFLIIYLVQMIGAEINEEKSTKSMEIIISNVSPKTHFLSKIISSNLFVIIQGLLIIIYAAIGLIVRRVTTGSSLVESITSSMGALPESINIGEIINKLLTSMPIILIMILLTFFAYSLLAGILASMTTNSEDYQQLQTPIVIISLIGYYLAIMSSMFKGSIFIRIMSYIPLISSMLSPILYISGELTIIDLFISIGLIGILIYILIKYGMKIYKVGILNYSGSNLWKKMLEALRR